MKDDSLKQKPLKRRGLCSYQNHSYHHHRDHYHFSLLYMQSKNAQFGETFSQQRYHGEIDGQGYPINNTNAGGCDGTNNKGYTPIESKRKLADFDMVLSNIDTLID